MNNRFGPIAQYKMLNFVVYYFENIANKNEKRYMSSFFAEFHEGCKKLENSNIDDSFKAFMLGLYKKHYRNKCKHIQENYSIPLGTHIENYVKARCTNIQNKSREVISQKRKTAQRERNAQK